MSCYATARRGVHRRHRVSAIGRAMRDVTVGIQLDIRLEVIERDSGIGSQVRFQSISLDRAIDLTQVVDTAGGLRRDPGFHEVRNRNRGEEANDGYHDHDFDQREPSLAGCSYLHTDL